MRQAGKGLAQKENVRGKKSFELQDDSTIKDESRFSASASASIVRSQKKTGAAAKRTTKSAIKESIAT